MSDDNPDVPRPPRFPYVAALLSAACVGAAAWTWMRYSYAWDVTPSEVASPSSVRPPLMDHPSEGRYVRTAGPLTSSVLRAFGKWNSATSTLELERLARVGAADSRAYVRLPAGQTTPAEMTAVLAGRIVASRTILLADGAHEIPLDHGEKAGYAHIIDTTASRFHPASIAGLVVGAMGVFVFTVALRHWLAERKAVAK